MPYKFNLVTARHIFRSLPLINRKFCTFDLWSFIFYKKILLGPLINWNYMTLIYSVPYYNFLVLSQFLKNICTSTLIQCSNSKPIYSHNKSRYTCIIYTLDFINLLPESKATLVLYSFNQDYFQFLFQKEKQFIILNLRTLTNNVIYDSKITLWFLLLRKP